MVMTAVPLRHTVYVVSLSSFVFLFGVYEMRASKIGLKNRGVGELTVANPGTRRVIELITRLARSPNQRGEGEGENETSDEKPKNKILNIIIEKKKKQKRKVRDRGGKERTIVVWR